MPRQTLPAIPATISFIDCIDCINRGDLDGLVELMTDEHTLVVLDEPPLVGRSANRDAWHGYFSSFPDYLIYPCHISTVGDVVAVLGTTTGSHLGLPDEEELRISIVWLAEVAGGRLSLWRIAEDTSDLRFSTRYTAHVLNDSPPYGNPGVSGLPLWSRRRTTAVGAKRPHEVRPSGHEPEGRRSREFLGRHGVFLGQISRGRPTLSRRPLWRCIGATMVTSGFAEFEAAAYGELAKPPPPLEGPGQNAWAFIALKGMSPAVSTGLGAREPPTRVFPRWLPVDVYRGVHVDERREVLGGSAAPARKQVLVGAFRPCRSSPANLRRQGGKEEHRAALDDQIAAERTALLDEMRRATGLGGRDRRPGGDEAERARKAVAARLRDTIGRITKAIPELGAHLDRSVTTGIYCQYRPDPALRWDVTSPT